MRSVKSKLPETNDDLGRALLARSVFDQLAKGAKGRAFTLGLIGEKGSGKSTVVSLVEKFAVSDNTLFLHFNPENLDDANALWREFYLKLLEALQARGMDLKEAFPSRWWKRFIPKPLYHSKSPSFSSLSLELDNYIEPAILDSAEQLLAAQLSSPSPLVEQIKAQMAGKKIIIVWDELGELKKNLIPVLAHGLKKFLNQNCFSFLLVMDEREASSQDLLRKLVDHCVPLDQLSELQCQHFFKAQIDQIPGLSQFDVDVSTLTPYLPRNLERLKAVIEDIKELKTEFLYPRDLERSWQIIILCSLLKENEPEVFKETLKIMGDPDYLKIFTLDQKAKARAEVDGQIQQLLQMKSEASEEKQDQLRRLLEGILMNYSQIKVHDQQLYSLLALMMNEF